MILTMVCSNCGKESEYSVAGMTDDTTNALTKAERNGWFIGATGEQDLCPECNENNTVSERSVTTRRFEIEIVDVDDWTVGRGILVLNQEVIDAVDDNWRFVFYNLNTPEQIAEHIAFNMFENNIPISRMDGFADMPDSYAVWEKHIDLAEDLEYHATEIKESK